MIFNQFLYSDISFYHLYSKDDFPIDNYAIHKKQLFAKQFAVNLKNNAGGKGYQVAIIHRPNVMPSNMRHHNCTTLL